jgi:hypothetical protein
MGEEKQRQPFLPRAMLIKHYSHICPQLWSGGSENAKGQRKFMYIPKKLHT